MKLDFSTYSDKELLQYEKDMSEELEHGMLDMELNPHLDDIVLALESIKEEKQRRNLSNG